MVLYLLSIALLRFLDLDDHCLEISIDHVGGGYLLVPILKGKHVLFFFWHLYAHSWSPYALAVGFMLFEQVFPRVTMETPLTEVFAFMVFALIMEQTVEVLDPGVVVQFALPYEKQMDSSNVPWLLAESVDDHLPTVLAKDIQGEVVLLLHSFEFYLVDWCGRVNSLKVEPIVCGVFPRSFVVTCCWK